MKVTYFYKTLIFVLLYFCFCSFIVSLSSITTFLVGGIVMMIWLFIAYSKSKSDNIRIIRSSPGYQSIHLCLTWFVAVLVHGLLTNYASAMEIVQDTFMNKYSTLALLLPLVVLLDVRRFNFQQFVKVAFILNILFFVALYVYRNEVFLGGTYTLSELQMEENGYADLVAKTSFVTGFFTQTAIIFLLLIYLPKKNRYLIIACGIVALMAVIAAGRRSSTASILLVLLAGFYLFSTAKSKSSKLPRTILLLSIVIVAGYYVATHMDTTFSIMSSRLDIDNRSDLAEDMIADFNNTPLDWIWGRGNHGYYKCSWIDVNNTEVAGRQGMRTSMETGYMYFILVGGIVNLLLYITCLLKAARYGWNHSNNYFVKAFAVYLVIKVVELVPFGLPAFDLSYLMVWIGIAICYTDYYCKMTDDDVRTIIFK